MCINCLMHHIYKKGGKNYTLEDLKKVQYDNKLNIAAGLQSDIVEYELRNILKDPEQTKLRKEGKKEDIQQLYGSVLFCIVKLILLHTIGPYKTMDIYHDYLALDIIHQIMEEFKTHPKYDDIYPYPAFEADYVNEDRSIENIPYMIISIMAEFVQHFESYNQFIERPFVKYWLLKDPNNIRLLRIRKKYKLT